MKKIVFVAIMLWVSLLIFSACGEKTQANNVDEVINATQFSKISSNDLKEIMGEPLEIEEWSFDSPNGNTYQVASYYYNDNNYEFMIIDDIVVRFTSYEKYSFTKENDIFTIFGITPSEDIIKSGDTGVTLRYRLVSEGVSEVWITNISEKTFDVTKITYALGYFEY